MKAAEGEVSLNALNAIHLRFRNHYRFSCAMSACICLLSCKAGCWTGQPRTLLKMHCFSSGLEVPAAAMSMQRSFASRSLMPLIGTSTASRTRCHACTCMTLNVDQNRAEHTVYAVFYHNMAWTHMALIVETCTHRCVFACVCHEPACR